MEWTTDLTVDDGKIDEQHRELFARITKLVEAIKSKTCKYEIGPTTKFLEEYIIEHFRDNTNLANNLKFWGANNYVFSNEERRIAKYLINAYDIDDRIPDLAELSGRLAISEDELRGRLAFMRRVGLLVESESEPLGYALTEKYMRWGGPLRHNFHTITIGKGKPFDVW